jgi:hypothetical protein
MYIQNNWSKILAMVEFGCNDSVHSSTQQTLLFANHVYTSSLTSKVLHKALNLATKD